MIKICFDRTLVVADVFADFAPHRLRKSQQSTVFQYTTFILKKKKGRGKRRRRRKREEAK